MADIFLSYAREDSARATQIADALTQAGYDVFWDAEIPPGMSWADFLERKLADCKAAVVLWSAASTASQWVREEARLARDRSKLIPVALDDSPPPFGFGEIQSASLKDWTGAADHPGWRLLLSALQMKMGEAPQPRPGPQPTAPPAPPRWNAPAEPAASAPEKKKPNLAVVIGGTVVATIVALAIIGVVTQPDAPEDPSEASIVALDLSALPESVQATIAKARDTAAEAKAAITEAEAATLSGTQAQQAAALNHDGHGVLQPNETSMLAGDIASMQAGEPAAVVQTMGEETFSGVVTVTPAGWYSRMVGTSIRPDQTTMGVTEFASASEGVFLGRSQTPSFVYEGRSSGTPGGFEVQNFGVITFHDGTRYEGEFTSRGTGDVTISRHGLGASFDARGNLVEAGRYENDTLVAPE